jgi:hypothetical protein
MPNGSDLLVLFRFRALLIGPRFVQLKKLSLYLCLPTAIFFIIPTSRNVSRFTGADAVMSAEGQLYNAALFATAQSSSSSVSSPLAFDSGLHLPHADLALEYLCISSRISRLRRH